MKTIKNFDIKKVKFDDGWDDNYVGTRILYFTAPKEWVNDIYKDAIWAEISVTVPIDHQEVSHAVVSISPTKRDRNGNLTDYDWNDIYISDSDVEALIKIGASKMAGSSIEEFDYDDIYISDSDEASEMEELYKIIGIPAEGIETECQE